MEGDKEKQMHNAKQQGEPKKYTLSLPSWMQKLLKKDSLCQLPRATTLGIHKSGNRNSLQKTELLKRQPRRVHTKSVALRVGMQ